jgi:hypothetical protein
MTQAVHPAIEKARNELGGARHRHTQAEERYGNLEPAPVELTDARLAVEHAERNLRQVESAVRSRGFDAMNPNAAPEVKFLHSDHRPPPPPAWRPGSAVAAELAKAEGLVTRRRVELDDALRAREQAERQRVAQPENESIRAAAVEARRQVEDATADHEAARGHREQLIERFDAKRDLIAELDVLVDQLEPAHHHKHVTDRARERFAAIGAELALAIREARLACRERDLRRARAAALMAELGLPVPRFAEIDGVTLAIVAARDAFEKAWRESGVKESFRVWLPER